MNSVGLQAKVLKAKLWERASGCVVSLCPFFWLFSGEMIGVVRNFSHQSSGYTQSGVYISRRPFWWGSKFLQNCSSIHESRVFLWPWGKLRALCLFLLCLGLQTLIFFHLWLHSLIPTVWVITEKLGILLDLLMRSPKGISKRGLPVQEHNHSGKHFLIFLILPSLLVCDDCNTSQLLSPYTICQIYWQGYLYT